MGMLWASEKKFICYAPPSNMSVGLLKEAHPEQNRGFGIPKKCRSHGRRWQFARGCHRDGVRAVEIAAINVSGRILRTVDSMRADDATSRADRPSPPCRWGWSVCCVVGGLVLGRELVRGSRPSSLSLLTPRSAPSSAPWRPARCMAAAAAARRIEPPRRGAARGGMRGCSGA